MKMLNDHYKETFGCKVYKLSLDGGFSCPNRDGRFGTGGCIFCTGSGEFAEGGPDPIPVQLSRAKARVCAKNKGGKYIAYFQAFTNTYAPADKLRRLYRDAIEAEDIVGLSIGTRPDCLGHDVMEVLKEINSIKPVSVELGLQTIHEETARYIRRGYEAPVYFDAVRRLKEEGLDVVKFHLLHVLKNTDLAEDYAAGKFQCLTMEEYGEILKRCIDILPDNIVVHRITGDGAKKDLIAPLWSADKKRVLNYLHKILE